METFLNDVYIGTLALWNDLAGSNSGKISINRSDDKIPISIIYEFGQRGN